MPNPNSKETQTLILIAAVILLYLWWSKPKGNLLQSPTGGAGAGSGCGCNGSRVNVTNPPNPTAGKPTATLSSTSKGRKTRADQSGAAAPGGNASAPGSGAQYQGVKTHKASSLTPASAPNSPYSPVGSNVWVGNATPAVVQG